MKREKNNRMSKEGMIEQDGGRYVVQVNLDLRISYLIDVFHLPSLQNRSSKLEKKDQDTTNTCCLGAKSSDGEKLIYTGLNFGFFFLGGGGE